MGALKDTNIGFELDVLNWCLCGCHETGVSKAVSLVRCCDCRICPNCNRHIMNTDQHRANHAARCQGAGKKT